MRIYCLYGTGKETERAYFYQQGGYEHDESPTVDFAAPGAAAGEQAPVCLEPNCTDSTPRAPLDLPLQRRVWIDGSVTLDEKSVPKVRSGVVFGDGDGTVSLLSLGAMCVEGWQVRLSLFGVFHSSAGDSQRLARSARCTTRPESRSSRTSCCTRRSRLTRAAVLRLQTMLTFSARESDLSSLKCVLSC